MSNSQVQSEIEQIKQLDNALQAQFLVGNAPQDVREKWKAFIDAAISWKSGVKNGQ